MGDLRSTELTHLRAGATEIVSQAYVAVRDDVWNTIPPRVAEATLTTRHNSFAAHLRCEHAEKDLALSWSGAVSGTAQGRIALTMDATAVRQFEYRRIGFCLLLPWEEYAGCRYRAFTAQGELEGKLPVDIAPQLVKDGSEQPLFTAFSRLSVRLAPTLEVVFSFEGEVFEIEDQRNWTDATFKVYGTPLALGGPFRAQAGDRFRQRLTIEVIGSGRRRGRAGEKMAVSLDTQPTGTMPAVGIGGGCDVGARRGLLKELCVPHLRVELVPGDRQSERELDLVASIAREVDSVLEVAVILADLSESEMATAAAALRGLPLGRVLVFSARSPVTSTGLCARMREQLRRAGLSGLQVAGGTNANFAELNRERPDLSDADAICWSINPQVHVFDDESLAATLPIQAQTVACARKIYPSMPVIVGPVTLRPRFNHDAGQFFERGAGDDERRQAVDVRQSTLFCAAWTVGSVCQLALAGASSVTYFETLGPRGVAPVNGETVFPVFHVVAQLARWRGSLLVKTTAPSDVAVIAVERSRRRFALVANLRAEQRQINAELGSRGRLLRLGVENVEQAMREREEFRHSWEDLPASAGVIELGPYGVAWLTLE